MPDMVRLSAVVARNGGNEAVGAEPSDRAGAGWPQEVPLHSEGHGAVSGHAVVTEEGSPAALGLWDKQGTPS